MDASEYLKENNPMLLGLIESYLPAKADLASVLESYHEAKSKEEAQERYDKAIELYHNQNLPTPNPTSIAGWIEIASGLKQ